MELLDSRLMIAFIVALVVIVGVLMFTTRKQGKYSLEQRIRKLQEGGGEEGEVYHGFDNLQQKEDKLADSLQQMLSVFRINTASPPQGMEMKFAQAGIRSAHAYTYYMSMKVLGLPMAGFCILLMTMGGGEKAGALKAAIGIVSMIILFIGVMGADMYLKNAKQKRQYVLQRSFPDALDLILVTVEAGLALDASLARVTKELEKAHPEITYELNKTRMELTLLSDRAKALQNLAERTDLVAFRQLCSALLQSEKFGTSLTETLRVLSEDYRTTRMLAAENKANKLPTLMTIPLMILLMPAFVMVLIGPAVIMLLDTWE